MKLAGKVSEPRARLMVTTFPRWAGEALRARASRIRKVHLKIKRRDARGKFLRAGPVSAADQSRVRNGMMRCAERPRADHLESSPEIVQNSRYDMLTLHRLENLQFANNALGRVSGS